MFLSVSGYQQSHFPPKAISLHLLISIFLIHNISKKMLRSFESSSILMLINFIENTDLGFKIAVSPPKFFYCNIIHISYNSPFFKVYSAVVFSIFIKLNNHHYCLIPEHFHHPPKPLYLLLTIALANSSALCLSWLCLLLVLFQFIRDH